MTGYAIETSNRQTRVPIKSALLEDAARLVLESEQIGSADLSLAVVDSTTMRQLNKKHLNHDYDTDVLSFLLEETTSAEGLRALEGEVIVSAAIALQQASRFGWSVEDEMRLYIVHGMLHLCGYDDHTDEQTKAMRSREMFVLNQLGLTPRYATD